MAGAFGGGRTAAAAAAAAWRQAPVQPASGGPLGPLRSADRNLAAVGCGFVCLWCGWFVQQDRRSAADRTGLDPTAGRRDELSVAGWWAWWPAGRSGPAAAGIGRPAAGSAGLVAAAARMLAAEAGWVGRDESDETTAASGPVRAMCWPR